MTDEAPPSPAPAAGHVNVGAYLPEMALRQPDALAVAVAVGRNPDGTGRYAELTAAELNRRSDRIAHALVDIGIGEGVRTVLMVKPIRHRAMLDYAWKLTDTPWLVGDEDRTALAQAGFGDEDIFDITDTVAYFNYTNRMTGGLGMQPNPEYFSSDR